MVLVIVLEILTDFDVLDDDVAGTSNLQTLSSTKMRGGCSVQIQGEA